MTADLWCLGWRRPPHVPTDRSRGLTVVRSGPTPYRLCEQCWRRWVDADREVQP